MDTLLSIFVLFRRTREEEEQRVAHQHRPMTTNTSHTYTTTKTEEHRYHKTPKSRQYVGHFNTEKTEQGTRKSMKER